MSIQKSGDQTYIFLEIILISNGKGTMSIFNLFNGKLVATDKRS